LFVFYFDPHPRLVSLDNVIFTNVMINIRFLILKLFNM